MEHIIDRLEAIHRTLRRTGRGRNDALVADSVAFCLRDLHAIAAQSRHAGTGRPSLHVIASEPTSALPQG